MAVNYMEQMKKTKPTNQQRKGLTQQSEPTLLSNKPVTTMGKPIERQTQTNSLLQNKPVTTSSISPQNSVNKFQASAASTTSSPPKEGWGIGYGDSNVGGGFSSFGDSSALQTEIDRLNTVMANRKERGMGNGAQQTYYDKLIQSQKQNTISDNAPASGWGIGYADDNIGNGFKEFYDPMALQKEIERMNAVMKNRESLGLDSTKYQNYLDMITSYNKPYEEVDPDDYRSESATLDDLMEKYGFDYSRDYANRQAEAEAQARRNAIEEQKRLNESNKELNLQAIDNNLMSMAEGLDRNYFQQYMQQAQNQTNSGINSGIAADQNLRLQMARQAEMGDSYRDANLGRMQENQRYTNTSLGLEDELGLVNQEALAREDALYNERLNQAFGQIMDINNLNLSYDQMGLNAALQNRSENLNYNQFNRNLSQQKREFDFDKEQFRWDRVLDEAGLTGYYKGNPTFDREQWNYSNAWDKYMFNNVSATDQASLDWDRYQFGNVSATDAAQMAQNQSQFNAGMAWDRYTFENMSQAEKEEMALRLQEMQTAFAEGQTYSELSPELKAFIDNGGVLGNHSTASGLIPSDFLDGSGGGGTSDGSNYGNYWKTKKEFASSGASNSFMMNLNAAMKKGGFPSSWTKDMIELVGRESTWNPNAENSTSTASGYGQFLDSTERDYESKYGLSYSNPVNQLILTMHYVKDRYGNPTAALRFWDKNEWY
jgi:hypothetical protein